MQTFLEFEWFLKLISHVEDFCKSDNMHCLNLKLYLSSTFDPDFFFSYIFYFFNYKVYIHVFIVILSKCVHGLCRKNINSIINRTWEDTHSSQTEIVRTSIICTHPFQNSPLYKFCSCGWNFIYLKLCTLEEIFGDFYFFHLHLFQLFNDLRIVN